MERRTFLKGAVIAASTPVVVLAPPMAAVTLGSLIAQYDEIDVLYLAADKLEGEIAKRPDRPAYPHIKVVDFGPYAHGQYANSKCLFTEVEINELFDREVKQLELNWKALHTPYREQRRVVIAAERERALAEYRSKKVGYEDWKESSGYNAAEDETARLANLMGKVEDKIIDHVPADMAEVKVKASFFHRAYAENPPERFITAFMQSLMA